MAPPPQNDGNREDEAADADAAPPPPMLRRQLSLERLISYDLGPRAAVTRGGGVTTVRDTTPTRTTLRAEVPTTVDAAPAAAAAAEAAPPAAAARDLSPLSHLDLEPPRNHPANRSSSLTSSISRLVHGLLMPGTSSSSRPPDHEENYADVIDRHALAPPSGATSEVRPRVARRRTMDLALPSMMRSQEQDFGLGGFEMDLGGGGARGGGKRFERESSLRMDMHGTGAPMMRVTRKSTMDHVPNYDGYKGAEEGAGPSLAVDGVRVTKDVKFETATWPSATTDSSDEEAETIKVGRKGFDDPHGVANEPHEALEFPPLYWLLRVCPCLGCFVKAFYRCRWSISYPLQRRIPFSKTLRKAGLVFTYGEVILVFPLIAMFVSGIYTSFVDPDVNESGHVARLPLALAFLTACHNSIVTLLMGMPFERAQKYHRVLGALGWLNGVFHTYTAFFYHTPSGNEPIPLSSDTLLDTKEGLGDTEEAQRALLSEDGDLTEYDHNNFALIGENGGHPVKINGYSNFGTFLVYDTINASGTGIIFLMLAMILTALPPVRRVCFEFFYYLHILFAMAITGCAFYHSGLFVVLLVSFLWGGDMVMRKVIMALCRYPRKANISYLTDTVVELSFPKTKGFAYNPSQYAFIAVPEISLFQWHPFTISSSPHEDTVRFHIRKRGRWTKALHKLTDSRHQVTLLIEGPFGCLSTNMFDNRYKMIMLLSGGIGVTPMQSICHQLMHEHEAGSRELKKLWFFWTARDPEIIDNMDVTVKNSVRYLMDIDDVDDIAEGVAPQSLEGGRGLPKNKSHGHLVDKALMNVTPSQITDEELEAMFPLEEIEEDDDQASQASQGPPIVNEDAKGADVERAYNPLPHSATMQNVLQEDAAAPTMQRGLSTPEFAGAAAEGKDGSNGSERNLAQGLSRTEHTRGMGPPYSSVRFQVETETIGHSQREVRDDPSPKSRPGLSFYTEPGGRGGRPGMSGKSKSWKPKEDTAADVLQLDFFLTAKEIKKQGAGEAVKDMPFVTQGRPQLKAIFARMREEAIRGGERRVAICLCAPKRLEDICRRACAKFSDGIVRFDFHSEVFD